jgi:hypothetical protein
VGVPTISKWGKGGEKEVKSHKEILLFCDINSFYSGMTNNMVSERGYHAKRNL